MKMDGERVIGEMRYGIRESKTDRESGDNHMRDEMEGKGEERRENESERQHS